MLHTVVAVVSGLPLPAPKAHDMLNTLSRPPNNTTTLVDISSHGAQICRLEATTYQTPLYCATALGSLGGREGRGKPTDRQGTMHCACLGFANVVGCIGVTESNRLDGIVL